MSGRWAPQHMLQTKKNPGAQDAGAKETSQSIGIGREPTMGATESNQNLICEGDWR